MTEVKVSIIVPVYNMEAYLARCLDSIVSQSLNDIEIIVLNDGSTDGSEAIIKRYEADDDRIRYISHDNIGLGRTRNRGIEAAAGEYIGFVDSDDFIEPDMYELMYEKAKNENLDVAVCETFIEENGRSTAAMNFDETSPYDISLSGPENFLREGFFSNKYRNCAWNKIYRKSIIVDNDIRFADNKEIYAEDLYFQFHLLLCNPVINFLPKTLYHYVQRAGSITSSTRQDFMARHLGMINHFYSHAKGNRGMMNMVDSVLFRGLLNEAGYCSSNGLGFKVFTRSLEMLYEDPAYALFVQSVGVNKSSRVIPIMKRRVLFQLYCLLLKLKFKWVSAWLLYMKMASL